jgi:flagellar capping protein FliD
MRYQYNINSLLSSGNASKVTSYLGSSQAAASSSGVDKTKAFLGAYQSDLTDLEKAADKLNYFKSGNVFTQYTLGSSDEDVAEISVNSLRKQKDFSVTVQNLATDSQPARYSITENGKTTQYTSASNTVQLINADATLTLRGTGTTNIYTGIDEDEIVTAMKDMVTAHNKTMETLSAGKGLGSGIEKQLSRMTGTLANGNIMSMVGLSYDKNGDLKLDEKRLRSALENDFDTTKELIGGQYGIASILGDRAANTLNESVRTIVGTTNTYSTMDLFGQNGRGLYSGNDISTNYMNMMFDFSRNTPYNYSNYYAVGSMLNLLG